MAAEIAKQRIVVTGLGVVSAIGNEIELFWQNLLAGVCGVKPITAWDTAGFPGRYAATVEDFDAGRYLDKQQQRRLELFTQFAIFAAMQAISDARLEMPQEDSDRVCVSIGSGIAGMGAVERGSAVITTGGPRRVNPFLIPSTIANMPACIVAMQIGSHGPTLCPVAACATGCTAIGEAARMIATGEADVAIAGGTDSVITPLSVASFGRLGALARGEDGPEMACRPFDVSRDGTVLGEGAAVLILESEAHARQREAAVLAEVAGYGASTDAYHITAPDPSGKNAAKAINKALAQANLTPSKLSYICAHGTATPLNDIAESKAIELALGDAAQTVPLASQKFSLGHTLGAAGAVSALTAVKAIGSGIMPGTLNLRQRDPECRVNAIAENLAGNVDAVLVNAFGFGGQNAALILRRWQP